LDPTLNLKTRYEEIEDLASYAKTLPPEAREWLNNFSEEYICANFNHKGTKLHTTDQQRKGCYNRNNARNRCVFSRQKAQGEDSMDYLEDLKNKEFESVEDNEPESLFDDVEEV